ncbi:hypothetical protein WJ88_01340 [Burkholderia ubonensis]|nr:hypothetical protein WJ88_01340 [Burkholderia ubonensis]OJB45924.1 hypothetical protein BGV57_03370 [Burkholderia ubonensis]
MPRANRARIRRSSADTLDIMEAQPHARRQRGRCAEFEHRRRIGTQQARCDIDEQFVHQPRAQQRPAQSAPCFHVQFVVAEPTEFRQHGGQVDRTARVRQRHDLDAARAQGLGARPHGRIEFAAEHQRRCACQQPSLMRQLEPAVDQHAPRLARRVDAAHVQLRIVGQHRADAGQDRAGPRAYAVLTQVRPESHYSDGRAAAQDRRDRTRVSAPLQQPPQRTPGSA